MSTDFRLSDGELEALLDDLESFRSERKESFSKETADRARQAVCAFANDFPDSRECGVLFIGARDDGSPSGIEITDDLLLNLAKIRSDGRILPLPVLLVEKRRLKGADMAVVTVLPSDMPPVKYDGRVWIRNGANRALATVQEERILNERRRFRNLPFDLCPIRSTTIDDLSLATFEEEYLVRAFAPDILRTNGRTLEEKLAACRMVVSPDDPTPTLTGLLAVGRDPARHVPGAYIQFLRIAGRGLADAVVDAETIGGDLRRMLLRADDKLRSHNRTAYDVESAATHVVNSDYPVAAVQQILFNAVLHRSYENTNAPVRFYWFDDRIEINSPGGPFGNVNAANFGQPGYTDYRNPDIAEVLRVYGFVQAFGRGIAIANEALARNGNPPLEFSVTPSCVNCIIRSRNSEPGTRNSGTSR